MDNIFITTFAISMLTQAVFFVFAAKFKTDKVTDLSYSLTFIFIAIYLMIYGSVRDIFSIIIAIAVVSWGMRLGTYLFIRILKMKKDSRFDEIREDFWRFAKFWFLQGITVWVVMLPIITFFGSNHSGISVKLFSVGISIWLFGLIFETIADFQKYSFIQNSKNRGQWINVGLWKYSRHPNYFGEITCWWGLFIAASSAFSGLEFASVIGPIFITAMILFVTGLPPLEKKADKMFGDKSGYAEYKKNTSILIPLPSNK
ncbi:MAG: DUF1295 domain-containing protein [Candidatus Spechtbacterales bacterium]|nr:DUF1295 domain-containing protein [Candidatus Spechtbacterales bacterium]